MASPVYNVTGFFACGNGSSTDPADLNNSAQVVGTCTDSTGNSSGFLFSGGAVSTINYPGADDTVLTGINNAGIIVGYYLLGGSSSSFMYENGSFTPFPFPGKTIWGANDTGLFVGTYSPTRGDFSGFITDGTHFQILNFPGAFDTHALSINNAGQVAGYYETTTTAAGFLFADGQYTSISIPGLVVYGVDINNNGEVVGQISSGPGPHNFLWKDGVFTLLDLGDGARSSGMNDFGQIVGFVYGSQGGFIATPVPEPAYFLIFIVGLVGVCAHRLVKRH